MVHRPVSRLRGRTPCCRRAGTRHCPRSPTSWRPTVDWTSTQFGLVRPPVVPMCSDTTPTRCLPHGRCPTRRARRRRLRSRRTGRPSMRTRAGGRRSTQQPRVRRHFLAGRQTTTAGRRRRRVRGGSSRPGSYCRRPACASRRRPKCRSCVRTTTSHSSIGPCPSTSRRCAWPGRFPPRTSTACL